MIGEKAKWEKLAELQREGSVEEGRELKCLLYA